MYKTINELTEYHFKHSLKDNRNQVYGYLELTGENIFKKGEVEDNRARLYQFYQYLYKKFKFKVENKEEFIQTFSLLFTDACYELKELEPLEKLLKDDKLYNTRMRAIKNHIERNIGMELNPDVERVNLGKDENGKNIYKYVTLNGLTSVNETVQNEDGESTELLSLLGEDSQLFTYGKEAHYTHFIQWFLDNKESILTKHQLEHFNKWREIYIADTDSSQETRQLRREMFEQAETTSKAFHKLKRDIKKRVVKAYEKEFGKNTHGFRTSRTERLNNIFKNYVANCNSATMFDSAEHRQIEMSKYVAKYYNHYEEFELTVTKGMSLDQKIEIVRAVKGKEPLSHKTIRLIKNNIEEHLEKEPINIKPAQQIWEGYSERTFSGMKDLGQRLIAIDTTGTIVIEEKGCDTDAIV